MTKGRIPVFPVRGKSGAGVREGQAELAGETRVELTAEAMKCFAARQEWSTRALGNWSTPPNG